MKQHKIREIKTSQQTRRSMQKQQQFEEADPTSKDRKIIKMRNILDLGDGQETKKRNIDAYDDQLLEQLDQWVEVQVAKKKEFNFDIVKSPEASSQNEFTSEQGPNINQAILNQIMKPVERQPLVEEDHGDVQVKFQMLRNKDQMYKTLDQVRIEMNKKILNTLLLQKVTKKLDELEINRSTKSSWGIQKMDEETTNVFREQSQVLKIKTLNNFKGLTEYFSNPAQYIDYDIVLTRAKHHSNRVPASFPSEQIPQSQQSSHSAKGLQDSYQNFQGSIKEHKAILFQMRMENNGFVQNLQKKEESISDIKRKYYQREEKAKQGWIPEQQQDGNPSRKRNFMETIEKIRLARDSEIKVIQKEIVIIKQQINQNSDKQTIIQKELDELRQKKRRCRVLLKDIYLKQFNESNYNLVPEGLIQIIKNMHKVNESAKIDYFPKFLTDESKQYLMQASQLEIEIDEVRQQQQKFNQSNKLIATSSKSNYKLGQGQTVTSIKNQVRMMMKKTKVTIKKPVFVQGIDPLNPSQFAHVIKWENQDLEAAAASDEIESSFKLQRLPSNQSLINTQKDLNQQLVSLQQELETLQKNEIERILKMYQNKRHLSDVQELKMVLFALFGQNIGDQLWYTFVIEWTDQKSLNPSQIFKQDNQRGTLLQLPEAMKQKMQDTYRHLTSSANIDYNFDLLQ